MPTSKGWIWSIILLIVNLSMFFLNFWDGPASKKILTFLSLQAAYGSQLCFVLVLWLNFIFVIYFFCVGTIWKKFYYLFIMPCVFLACYIVDPIILWLCQLVVLDACKGATHDCLNVGLVSYQVPLALQQSRWQSTPVQ